MGRFAYGYLNPATFFHHFISPPQAKNLEIRNKSVLITGGNSGIGYETVKELAKSGASKIVIASRDVVKSEKVIEELKSLTALKKFCFEFEKLDLGSQKNCKELAEKIAKEHKFDVIIANSGVISNYLKETEDGYEFHMGVNHFGHHTFLLTYLNNIQKTDRPSRLVVLSSTAQYSSKPEKIVQDSRFANLRKTTPMTQYGQSKLANLLFTRVLAEKCPEMQVNAVHPGVVQSNLWYDRSKFQQAIFRVVNKLFFRKTKDGAQTMLHVGFSGDVNESGSFWANCENQDRYCIEHSRDMQYARDFWDFTVKETGVDLQN